MTTPRIALLLLPALAAGCAQTLDHQAELLLHPAPVVQAPALLGAAPGALVGTPVWGTVALIAGPESEAAGWAMHVFAYPGALLLGGLPRLLAGPSWAGADPPATSPGSPPPGRRGASRSSP